MAEQNTTKDRDELEEWEDTPKSDISEDKKAEKKRQATNKSINLVEKYQPENLSEIAGQDHLSEILNDFVEKKHINHMIFIGPPGVGKTSVAKILARELLGYKWELNFLEVNVPNDNKDLKFINSHLKDFIKNKPIQAPFRIAFLDECDDLNREAQSALRKILESKEYKHIRFIFATNYSEKLISQLQGERMNILHFKKISTHIVEAYLNKICNEEGITYEGNALKIIAEDCDGSLRKGVGNLDFLTDKNNHISLQKLKNSISYLEPSYVKELLQKAINNEDYIKYLDQLINNQSLSIPKLLQEVIKVIDEIKFEDSKDKRYVIDQLGLYSWRISQSSDNMLQMKCFLNSIASMHDTCYNELDARHQ
jgi:DNA polymerase III, gamma/tau subunits